MKQWRAAEAQLGVRLPQDYREFIFTYGSGLFAGNYVIYNPFSSSKHIRLLDRVKQVSEINRYWKQKYGDKEMPYAVYPEKDAILPWGRDYNGNDYYWLTAGAPSKWKVVQNNVRGSGFVKHNCNMTGFLAGILEGRIQPLIGDFPNSESFVFQAYQPKKRHPKRSTKTRPS